MKRRLGDQDIAAKTDVRYAAIFDSIADGFFSRASNAGSFPNFVSSPISVFNRLFVCHPGAILCYLDTSCNSVWYILNMSARSRIPHPPVRAPELASVQEDFLVWEYSRDDRESVYRTPTDATVLAFGKLADAPVAQIADFAKRYGVLSVLQIKPDYRRNTDIELPDGSIWRYDQSAYNRDFQGREPIELWRFLARRLRAILRINASLKGRSRATLPQIGTEADWQILGGGEPLVDVRDAQFFLLLEVNHWLATGAVGLQLGITEWSRTKTDWKLEVKYGGLLGSLAYRLLLIVIGEGNLYACDGCGLPYIRTKRAPRPGEENFCDDCDGVAAKRAVQRFRERNRSKAK